MNASVTPIRSPHLSAWTSLAAYDWLDTPVWVYDVQNQRRLWANDAAKTLWGDGASDRQPSDDLFDQTSATRTRLTILLERACTGHTPSELWTFQKGTRPIQILVHMSGIQTEDGRAALLCEGVVPTADRIAESITRRVEAFRHTGALISLHRRDGTALMRNPAAAVAFGPSRPEVGADDLAVQLSGAEAADKVRQRCALNETFTARVWVQTRAGPRWHDVSARHLQDPATGEPLILLDAQDVTEAQQAHARLESEKNVLEMISRGRPLSEIFRALILLAEVQCPGLICSIIGIRDGRVQTLTAPNLPTAYCHAIEGAPIGPKAGSCGTAAWRRQPVIVEDIATDPLWADYKDLALSHGLRACWSVPIQDPDGEVLGTFAAYYGEPRLPTSRELALLDAGKYIAAIAFERSRAADAIEHGRQQLQMILDAMPTIIAYADQDHRYRFINRAFERWFGTTREQAIGKLSRDIIGEPLFDAIQPHLERVVSGQEVHYERQSQDAAGRPRHLDVQYIPHLAADGSVLGHFGIVQDVTGRKENEQMLEYLATHDQLTGLPNRTLLGDHLELELARSARTGRHVAVLFVDLDRFKNVNDTLGHDQGDRLLQAVAERFRTAVRGADTVARLGGDEFVVLMTDLSDLQEAATLAQKLIAILDAPFVLGGHEIFVAASIGIAVGPDDGSDAATLLKHADTAMYRAKDRGRGGFQFHSAEATTRSVEHLTLSSALRRAVERNEFVLHFQPIVDLRTGRATSVEALVRWQHPELGLVSPATFIPLAEDTGLIVPIGQWVLEEACRQIHGLDAAGDLRLAANLSPRQFRDQDLAATIERILARVGLPPARLSLEVTESSMMENPEAAIRTLERLRADGASIAIDDFGTGYSSLSFLRRFPIDCLKVDKSFVQDIVHDESDANIVRAVIAMGHALKLDIVAEGVETEAQLAFLHAEGCHRAQGFLFSRPLDCEALATWLARTGPPMSAA
ncbi:MAG: EAL domain-containing protein [Burkholderiales bacterium]|nr:EAL domain-containing protein [Burkholderiales bacterium]